MSEKRQINEFWVQHELPWFPVVHPFPLDPQARPFALSEAEVIAIRCLKEGNASSYQQQIAVKALVEKVTAAHDVTFRPGADGDRASAFAEGRRWVGLQIIRALNLPFKPSGDSPSAPRRSEPESKSKPRRRQKPGTRNPATESADQ